MSTKNTFSRSSRVTTGPLYTARELEQTQDFLQREGYSKVEDNKTLGMSVYHKLEDGKKTGDAVIYLDHLGCHPDNSGVMILAGPGSPAAVTSVWDYAREKRVAAATNPVSRLIRRLF